MATLPPRRSPPSVKISKERLTPLQTLLQLGFSQTRAQKALAATGCRGAKSASDWLLAHVQDPNLDSDEPREYVLCVRPTEILAERLQKFWSESKELGSNKGHHLSQLIVLVPFFKVPDESAEVIGELLEGTTEQDECPKRIELETNVTSNSIALFVEEKQAKWLQSLATRYVEKLRTVRLKAECTSLSIAAEVALPESLRLKLLEEFPSNFFQPLLSMVQRLNPNFTGNLELGLYSRDWKFRDSRVYRVTHPREPGADDELELRLDDYIYIEPEIADTAVDGWALGTSWSTGLSGYLPINHTDPTAESEAWTLHATLRITEPLPSIVERGLLMKNKPPGFSSSEYTDSTDGIPSDNQPNAGCQAPTTPSRQIFIFRHGERVDFTFGAWIPYCFEANGTYVQRDLNMPKKLPPRNTKDFQSDSPLTTVGEMQASLLGDAMRTANVKIDVAFASPSLRCVQTLAQILKSLGSDARMKIEPGLIEWLAWYPIGLPTWMSNEELLRAGFDVDPTYEAITKAEDLPARENIAQYYDRSHDTMRRIIENTSGNILIVAHAASLAACSRQLVGGRVPPAAEISRLVQRIPYLACLTVREESNGWQIHPPPFSTLTHTSNGRFDWKILI